MHTISWVNLAAGDVLVMDAPHSPFPAGPYIVHDSKWGLTIRHEDNETKTFYESMIDTDRSRFRLTSARPKSARWFATVAYRTNFGRENKDVWLDELSDLQHFVERGPSWDTVVSVQIIRVNHNESADLTVERAKRL